MIRHILGAFLHAANARPPYLERRAFYAMKERILDRWGTPDGYDLQHFLARICFACNGTGWRYGWDWADEDDDDYAQVHRCDHCSGTGEYMSAKTIGLDRYRLGRYVFHVPHQVPRNRPVFGGTKTFEGRLNHATPRFYINEEAAMWLALAFDRPMFLRLFGHWGCSGPKRTPLVILSTWLADLRSRIADVRSKWRARRLYVSSRDDQEIPF